MRGATDFPRYGRPKMSQSLNALLTLREKPHSTPREIFRQENVSRWFIAVFLKTVKFHPYKVHLNNEVKIILIDEKNFVKCLCRNVSRIPNF